MWVIFTKTYAGSLGMFLKGERLDVEEAILKQLPEDCFGPSVAPHEDRVDLKAVKAAELVVQAKAAVEEVNKLNSDCSCLRKTISDSSKELAQKQPEVNHATKKAEKLCRAAGIKFEPAKAAGNAKG